MGLYSGEFGTQGGLLTAFVLSSGVCGVQGGLLTAFVLSSGVCGGTGGVLGSASGVLGIFLSGVSFKTVALVVSLFASLE